MSQFPYRVRQLRTLLTTAVGNERDWFMESTKGATSGWVIWRISDTVFRVAQHLDPNRQAMASETHAPRVIAEVHVSQVRDWQPYRPGEEIPWPDELEPPPCVDSSDAMLGALAGGGATHSTGTKGKRAAA